MTTHAPTKEKKTRSLRMDDERWEYFIEKLGNDWFREMIDLAIAENFVSEKKIKTLTNRKQKP